ncbi:wax ester/triacylglycerol synthase domain-containing protein [Pseudonocardia sp. N23]|uniref:wax ester/triacylglycerol synthase domain-containing protein n=1 Tax=Pseudonocardia sp. N23 TaxID=1987376 RepID=UPI000BFC3F30|nr:wax ester/triacylglycerol synthase domain-containing protein [Pseudonocardia sp. N23]GAY11555.1 putative integral membrane protein [Pseudonocardia sp. N23]
MSTGTSTSVGTGTGTRPAVASPPAPPAPPPGAPRRVLLVTGSLGEGHHAAARAVEEQARALWPGVEVVWTETLDAMGPAAGSLFPAIYAGCVRRLPWLYELYFRALWHVPPFRAGTRAVVSRWSARGIATALAAHEPDLVVATFPEAVLGLGRLRRTGRLTVPAAALVADPAPHPLWGDKALDLHLVSTPGGARLLRRAVPGAAVRVAALPVTGAFAPPADDAPVRARPLVYVSCGSLAFGDVAGACAAVLDGGGDVLVSAGRVPSVRTRLERLAGHHPRGVRMRVVDWVSDPAATTRDCDAVVTNAGGATALEALACARPLLLFAPIPGHGRANAELLAREGLATVCPGPDELRDAVAALVDPGVRADTAATLRARLAGADLAADVAALVPARPDTVPGERVRAQDALFLHAATADVPQQVGARLLVEDVTGPGAGPGVAAAWQAHVAQLVTERAGRIELLTRRLAPVEPGRARRWVVDPAPDPARHVRPDTVSVGPGGDHATWDDALTAFFTDPVDPERTGWQILIARHTGGEGIGVLAKVHHALGDGLAVTDALIRLLTDEEAALPGRPSGRGPGDAGGPPTVRDRVRAAARIVRGVAGLATAGTAGRSPLTGRVGGPGHHRVGVRLDGKQVRETARGHGVGTTALVLAVIAEFLHRHLDANAPGGAPDRVRAMVPLTTRTARGVGSRSAGNRTAAVSLDLPTGVMTPAARVARVAELLDRGTTSGQPEGAAAVLRLLGVLPGRAQGPLVGGVYGRRFFHLLASVMPGARRPLHMRGALISEVYPVLPLAEGVGLAVGALNWGRWTTLGVSVDAGIVRGIGGIPDCLHASLRDMSDVCGRG